MEIVKGTRVVINSRKAQGKVGTVFWVGPNEWRRRLLKNAPSLAEQIARVAASTGLACSETVYLLSLVKKGGVGRGAEAPKPGVFDRVGRCICVTGRKPTPVERGLTLVLTLDLETVSELRGRFPGARALGLFIDSPEDGFDRTAVVAFSPEECARGVRGGRSFVAERAQVPPEVFDDAPGGALELLRARLGEAPAYALGRPFFIQSERSQHDGEGFVLSAGEGFSGLNLGDNGRLYVYANDAFWECH